MSDRILVTGGTGKTGRLVAGQLVNRGIEALIATRYPSSADHVYFDWDDPTSHASALDGVTSVYLVAPTDRTEQLPAMRPFLEQAVSRASGRLVLQSASSLDEGGPMMGEVHAWLHTYAPRWTVLRPSWFMQNFTTQHLPSITHDRCIYSATQDGRVPFIDVADIAAVGVEALTDPALASRDHVLTGPEALTYDEVAHLIAEEVSRPVHHLRLSMEKLTARYVGVGIPQHYAMALARMDEAIAQGAEDRTTVEVERMTGHTPNSFVNFLATNRSCFDTA
ncbi:NAD(P)H-binding protein [Novosphingopyxis sp.]|uniref:NmrA family NAD(P)-binding protein n=1 Tax=Novosphingopyxis sp. TaxID=2709690 RepID=UPI003B58F6C5